MAGLALPGMATQGAVTAEELATEAGVLEERAPAGMPLGCASA